MLSEANSKNMEEEDNLEKTEVEDEDLEEGEITDDEEEQAHLANKEEAASHNNDKSNAEANNDKENNSKKDKSSSHRHKSSRSDSKRLKKELDAEEEKKRLLKEKLRQLERQMADEDEDFDEDEEEEEPANTRKRRGSSSPDRSRSRSPKRRRRSRSRDRKNKPSRDSERRSRRDQEKKKEVCQQFMLGKCPKSPERCPYSHDAEPPKIMELCKFYLLERCAKKEKCLYLHKGFPCKYFHTGHRCLDTAETCKFSHDNLSDITRNILLKHLEAAPKEILGDFPRLTREAAQALVFQTEAKLKGWLSEDETKSPQEVQKAVGDAVIEEAKRHIPRKSRWGEPAPDQVDLNRPPPFVAPPPLGPGLLGPPPMGLRPLVPPPGIAIPRGPFSHFNNGPNGGPPLHQPPPIANFQNNPPPQQQMAFPPGYGDLGFGEDQMRAFIRDQQQQQQQQQFHPPPQNHLQAVYEQHQQQRFNHPPPFGGSNHHHRHHQMHHDPYHDQDYNNDQDNSRGGNTTPVPDDKDDQGWGDQYNSQSASPPQHSSRMNQPGSSPTKTRDPRRDPRMNRSNTSKEDIEKEKEKLILEMDLSILGDLDLPNEVDKEGEGEEEPNDLGLPFKSHAPNSVAKEIDASILAHSPLEYRLRKVTLAKPDYSGLLSKQHIPMSRIQLDPRLRRYTSKPPQPAKKETTPDPELGAAVKTTEENVYNPSRDLYSKSSSKADLTSGAIQEVYSPSQDVQDLYKPPAALLERPPPALGDSYNPRQDLARLGGGPISPWENNYAEPPFRSNNAPNAGSAPVRGDPRRRDPRRRD